MLYSPESHEPLLSRQWGSRCRASGDPRDRRRLRGRRFRVAVLAVSPRATTRATARRSRRSISARPGVIYALDLLARPRPCRWDAELRPCSRAVRRDLPRRSRSSETWGASAEPVGGGDGDPADPAPTGAVCRGFARPARRARQDERRRPAPRVHVGGAPARCSPRAPRSARHELWRESADPPARHLGGLGPWWTQDPRRPAHCSSSAPAHGFAGCVAALATRAGRGAPPAGERDVQAARSRGGRFSRNWPAMVGDGLLDNHRDRRIRTQWCHGAPGMVACLAEIAPGDDEHERLLLAGGELTWHAGPLEKGREPLPWDGRERPRVS